MPNFLQAKIGNLFFCNRRLHISIIKKKTDHKKMSKTSSCKDLETLNQHLGGGRWLSMQDLPGPEDYSTLSDFKSADALTGLDKFPNIFSWFWGLSSAYLQPMCPQYIALRTVAPSQSSASDGNAGLPKPKSSKITKNRVLNTSPGSVKLELPPRYMWGWGPGCSGYCGSCTIQTAGLYYGNWICQQLVRSSVGDSEILLEKNLEQALDTLGFTWDSWDRLAPKPQYKAHWVWIKQALQLGHPVIGTVFAEKGGKFLDYDHIVNITGYKSRDPLAYSDSDTVYYNDLKAYDNRDSTLLNFAKSREEARTPKGDLTISNGLAQWCFPKFENYGTAVTGFAGEAECLPAKLAVGRIYEPDWSKESGLNEKPMMLKGTLAMDGLTPGVWYTIYRFSARVEKGLKFVIMKNLPRAGFGKAGTHAFAYSFVAQRSEAVFVDLNGFMSDSAQFYRVVKKESTPRDEQI
jgi:hypothetical protein